MKQRVAALVGPVAEKMWVSTFHSACVRILRRDGKALGYPSSFTIYDQADAVRLTGYVVRDLNLDSKRFPPRSVHATISAAKNDGVDVEAYAAEPRSSSSARSPRCTASTRPGSSGPAPWTSTTCWATWSRLFREHPDVLEHYRQRFTPRARGRVPGHQPRPERAGAPARRRAPQRAASWATADQTIYHFRGADIRNILEFEEAFPDATVIVLEQNYRSTQTILDAANAVIANNLGRKPKELWTDQGHGQAIVRYHADDEGDESQWVAHQISHLHDGDHRWGDVAVFYRTNAPEPRGRGAAHAVGHPLQGHRRHPVLRPARDQGRAGLPEGARQPRRRGELKRVLNVPKRGVGDTTVGRLDAWANGHGVAFIDALRRRRGGRHGHGRAGASSASWP